MSVKRLLAIYHRVVDEVSCGRPVGFSIRRGQHLTETPVILMPIPKRDKHPKHHKRRRLRMQRRQQKRW